MAYSKHCFESLRKNAGCEYDHYVLDQGSQDDTVEWLWREQAAGRVYRVLASEANLGISRGMNQLIDNASHKGYDFYVGFDNDCEVTTPGTLKTVCELAGQDWILSPRIDGLNNPVHSDARVVEIGGHRIGETGVMGNIFRVVPAAVYEEGYRYNEDNPPWGGEETQLCEWWAARGGKCGYVLDLAVNHYEGTEQQKRTYPEYWERKKQEMGIA